MILGHISDSTKITIFGFQLNKNFFIMSRSSHINPGPDSLGSLFDYLICSFVEKCEYIKEIGILGQRKLLYIENQRL